MLSHVPKSAVHHLVLVTAPTPNPAICSSFGISSDCWRSKPGLLQLCRCATAQPSAGALGRDVQRAVLAGSSLLGAESGLEWWLRSALSREA